jgi:hypothetical protein
LAVVVAVLVDLFTNHNNSLVQAITVLCVVMVVVVNLVITH